MNGPMTKQKAALLAGGAIALMAVLATLAGALPAPASLLSCCCCGLMMLGGLLAAYLYLKDQPPSAAAPYGDCAMTGLMAGAIGALLSQLLTTPLQIILAKLMSANLQEKLDEAKRSLEQANFPPAIENFLLNMMDPGFSVTKLLIGLAVNLFFLSILGLIGGAIGAAIFHKKGRPAVPMAPEPPPPPPMNV